MERILEIIKPNILSEIARDIGQVFFAGVVVGQIVEISNVNWSMVAGGFILSLISWGASIIISDINK